MSANQVLFVMFRNWYLAHSNQIDNDAVGKIEQMASVQLLAQLSQF